MSLVASLLTLLSVMKIWIGVFWGGVAPQRDALVVRRAGPAGGPPLMVAPTVVLLLGGLALAVAAGPVLRLCDRAAGDLLHPAAYIQAVLG